MVNVCAGTWGALLNLAERKGRHTAHTWMDFSIGFFAVSLVCGLYVPVQAAALPYKVNPKLLSELVLPNSQQAHHVPGALKHPKCVLISCS